MLLTKPPGPAPCALRKQAVKLRRQCKIYITSNDNDNNELEAVPAGNSRSEEGMEQIWCVLQVKVHQVLKYVDRLAESGRSPFWLRPPNRPPAALEGLERDTFFVFPAPDSAQ